MSKNNFDATTDELIDRILKRARSRLADEAAGWRAIRKEAERQIKIEEDKRGELERLRLKIC